MYLSLCIQVRKFSAQISIGFSLFYLFSTPGVIVTLGALKRRSNPKPSSSEDPRGTEQNLFWQMAPNPAPDPLRAAGVGGSRARKWLFRISALIVTPLMVLGLAEAGLRLVGFGHSTAFFKKMRLQGRDVFVENDKFGLRFFARDMARNPAPVVMDAVKAPGAFRVFLMGESAALGDPRPAYGMGRYLEVLLRERFPGTEFEVVCVAMTAINSHAILPIARECARHQGDLWIVYMGNNEMVGPFGAATVFGRQVPSLLSIRLTLALKNTRLGQWIDSGLGKWQAKSPGPWAGMSMFLDQQVAAADPRRQVAYRHFARNLDEILDLAGKSGCPVVLSTVASNLRDCAPFASVHSTTTTPALKAEYESLCQRAATLAMSGDLQAALANYERARKLDAQFAETEFRLGQGYLRLTNLVEAKKAFIQARDTDALPFRADSKINEILRQTATRHSQRSVDLVAADEALERQITDGVPGAESFFEHVHFNFSGNYRLARILAEAVEPRLPASITQHRTAAWASPETCERRLALTDWNRVGVLEEVLRRLQAAPFTRQANHPDQLNHWRAELGTLKARLTPARATEARAIYSEALLRAPRDHRLYEGYAEFLEATGSFEQAAAQWQAISQLLPHHFAAYVHAGRLLARQKQWNPAEERLRTALVLEPRSSEGHLEMGRVLAGQEKLEEAIEEYRRAIRWQPGNARAYFHLADALARKDDRPAAMEALRKAVQIQPSYWEARYLLGVELAMNERVSEARGQFEEVLRWRPDHVLARINLGVAYVKEGRFKDARAQFEEALRLDPKNQRARQHLETLQQGN